MLGPVNGRRGVVQAMLDMLAWMVALSFVSLIRNNLSVSMISWSRLAVVMVLAMAVQLVVGYAAALYRGRWRLGSFDEAMALATCTALTTGVVSLVVLIGINHAQVLVPASTAVMA